MRHKITVTEIQLAEDRDPNVPTNAQGDEVVFEQSFSDLDLAKLIVSLNQPKRKKRAAKTAN